MIQQDCIALFRRALLNKQLCGFGEDGLGKYGQNPYPSYFDVIEVDVSVSLSSRNGWVGLHLGGYDSTITGHVMTDKNFEISLFQLLKAADINPDSVSWQPNTANQGAHSVEMNFDLGLLLDWK